MREKGRKHVFVGQIWIKTDTSNGDRRCWDDQQGYGLVSREPIYIFHFPMKYWLSDQAKVLREQIQEGEYIETNTEPKVSRWSNQEDS